MPRKPLAASRAWAKLIAIGEAARRRGCSRQMGDRSRKVCRAERGWNHRCEQQQSGAVRARNGEVERHSGTPQCSARSALRRRFRL